MDTHIEEISLLPRMNAWYETKPLRIFLKALLRLYTGSQSKANSVFQKNRLAFIIKSQNTTKQIKNLNFTPDLIFHIFGTYSPLWKNFDIPYVVYLDYTTALAEQKWSSSAYFLNSRERSAWFKCESLFLKNSQHLFCMSNVVKKSLVDDYGIQHNKITVLGSSGDFLEPSSAPKTFGSKQILFNGSDFERKGGDLVLSAFQKVKKVIPAAKLVIIGKKLSVKVDGIINPGHIPRSDIHNLLQGTDLVVAPAYCDPFPTFLMEAMNYGIPCIVSANDGMPEIIEHQVNGLVIDQPNSEVLAEQIIYLLNSPELLLSMSQAAHAKLKNKLNWKNIAMNIINTINTIDINGSSRIPMK